MKYRFLWHGLLLFLIALAVISPRFAAGQQTAPPQNSDRRSRPQPQQFRVEKLPADLLKVLNNWERAGKQIKSLQGDHRRYVYDLVFEVERRADGKFYYESPDKGRIDLEVVRVKANENSRKIGKAGQPFKVQSDNPERWVCDGKQIMQINDVEKTYEKFVIPPEARGQNIMNGPLPFLFGMSAKDAQRRYKLKLLAQNENEVRLHVKPRWRQDAANWREAYVILATKTYLPKAVKMVDPAGNLETVYTFANYKINGGRFRLPEIFRGNPFAPKLPGYVAVQNNPNAQKGKVADRNPKLNNKQQNGEMPSVVGLDWKVARAVLEAKDYQVQFVKGIKANDPKQVYHVYQQTPLKGKPKTIQLRLYDKMDQTAGR